MVDSSHMFQVRRCNPQVFLSSLFLWSQNSKHVRGSCESIYHLYSVFKFFLQCSQSSTDVSRILRISRIYPPLIIFCFFMKSLLANSQFTRLFVRFHLPHEPRETSADAMPLFFTNVYVRRSDTLLNRSSLMSM